MEVDTHTLMTYFIALSMPSENSSSSNTILLGFHQFLWTNFVIDKNFVTDMFMLPVNTIYIAIYFKPQKRYWVYGIFICCNNLFVHN